MSRYRKVKTVTMIVKKMRLPVMIVTILFKNDIQIANKFFEV